MSGPWIAVVAVLSIVVALLAVGFVALSKRVENVLHRVETWLAAPQLRPPGLQPGSHVHSFSALRQDGQPLTDRHLRGRQSIILFMKADCVVCRSLARRLSRQALDSLGIGSTTWVVVRDARERDAVALDPQLQILFQEDGTVSWAFRSSATPQAFVVNGDGLIAATGFPNDLNDLRELVRVANIPGASAPSY